MLARAPNENLELGGEVMFRTKMQFKAILQAFAALLLFAAIATAQIPGLCDTGETHGTTLACSGVLVPPNPPGGGTNRDGRWDLAYPYPSTLEGQHGPCVLTQFINAWVDTPNSNWLSNSSSTVSEWITPFDGENNLEEGWYVYRTTFYVPSVLPGGVVPTGVTINGHLVSDNPTFGIYMESPANGSNCALVSGQEFPVNPAGLGNSDYQQWWDFSFTNPHAITAGAYAYVYFVVQNTPDASGPTPTGLRVEFFASSAFN